MGKLYPCYSGRFQYGLEGVLLPGSGSSFSWGLSGRLCLHIWDRYDARGTAGASVQGPGERADCCTNLGILRETKNKINTVPVSDYNFNLEKSLANSVPYE